MCGEADTLAGVGVDELPNSSPQVRVSILPEREEILIRSLCFDGIALQGVGSADLEMRECAD